MLARAGFGAIGLLAGQSALSQLAFHTDRHGSGKVLVVIFLRGGADGLNIVTPYREDAYYRNRPALHLAAPTDGASAAKERLLDLDGFFGLHPAMGAAYPLFREGKMGFVHACGSADQTRSHFDAMSAMERGLAQASGTTSSGWIARFLDATPAENDSPLRAVALSSTMPDSLRGSTSAIAFETIGDFVLRAPDDEAAAFQQVVSKVYKEGKDEVSVAGQKTLKALQRLRSLDLQSYRPSNSAVYKATDLGTGLKQVAMLVKADAGLEVACLDKGGWDTHVTQGNATGLQASNLTELSEALSAFHADLGPLTERVTTIVMTEFGRRLRENSGFGTDHGRAGVMMLMGAGIVGAKVHGTWPGLEEHQLEGPGDLRVTTDYRNVIGEVVHSRFGVAPDAVFPGLAEARVGITT